MNPVFSLHAAKRFGSRAQQRGIGIAGFIIGIVVGLAVALAVAVYITKVPTPFNDKSGVKTAEQQAAEEAKLKNWDPNAPLAGKRPNGSASGTVQPATAAAPVPPAAQQPTPPATTTAQPSTWPGQTQPPATAASGDALGDRDAELARARAEAEAKLKADLRAQELARAKAKAKAEEEARHQAEANASNDPIGSLLQSRNRPAGAAPATGGAEPFVYFVQAGAFRDSGDADAQKARLSLLGMNARVTEREQAGRTVYRVRLGPFNNKAEADGARARLENNGLDAALVRVER